MVWKVTLSTLMKKTMTKCHSLKYTRCFRRCAGACRGPHVSLSSAQSPPTKKNWCCQLKPMLNALLLTGGLCRLGCVFLPLWPQTVAALAEWEVGLQESRCRPQGSFQLRPVLQGTVLCSCFRCLPGAPPNLDAVSRWLQWQMLRYKGEE